MRDNPIVKLRFQFLIGTIKTKKSTKRGAVGIVVSIPYRYDKNAVIASDGPPVLQLFQFLIGTIKTHSG